MCWHPWKKVVLSSCYVQQVRLEYSFYEKDLCWNTWLWILFLKYKKGKKSVTTKTQFIRSAKNSNTLLLNSSDVYFSSACRRGGGDLVIISGKQKIMLHEKKVSQNCPSLISYYHQVCSTITTSSKRRRRRQVKIFWNPLLSWDSSQMMKRRQHPKATFEQQLISPLLHDYTCFKTSSSSFQSSFL